MGPRITTKQQVGEGAELERQRLGRVGMMRGKGRRPFIYSSSTGLYSTRECGEQGSGTE